MSPLVGRWGPLGASWRPLPCDSFVHELFCAWRVPLFPGFLPDSVKVALPVRVCAIERSLPGQVSSVGHSLGRPWTFDLDLCFGSKWRTLAHFLDLVGTSFPWNSFRDDLPFLFMVVPASLVTTQGLLDRGLIRRLAFPGGSRSYPLLLLADPCLRLLLLEALSFIWSCSIPTGGTFWRWVHGLWICSFQ